MKTYWKRYYDEEGGPVSMLSATIKWGNGSQATWLKSHEIWNIIGHTPYAEDILSQDPQKSFRSLQINGKSPRWWTPN